MLETLLEIIGLSFANCWGTVDIGCDIHSSEVMNSFLNTKDFTGQSSPSVRLVMGRLMTGFMYIDTVIETGIVTEKALVDVYDAYAHTSARLFTERWDEPTTRLCCLLYTVSVPAS